MSNYFKLFYLLGAMALFSACSNGDETSTGLVDTVVVKETPKLDVYKSPTCGCCSKWVGHLNQGGIETVIHESTNLRKQKKSLGIKNAYQSCHTAISKEGYIFEGHVPADQIQKFLENPPKDALGLAVPEMPIGSPGMEMGQKHGSYSVLLLKKDGESEVYAHITDNLGK